jgi:ATP-binding cassette subfamily F protein uup
MVCISVDSLFKKMNDRVLFQDVTFSIQEQEKVALIGTNGSGKSTLLKILAQEETIDGGRILTKNGLKVHLLRQNPVFTQTTVWQEIIQYQKQCPTYQVKSILTKLGFSDFDLPISTLSGGQKKRLALAIVLMEPCDLLLLDEPTNHLDEEMIEWLEKELKQTKSAVCMVTHDRYFLDRITDTILEIDEGKFYIHHGNYATFLENKAIRQEQEVQKQKKLKALYKKELAWVRAGAQARSTKQQARLNRFEDLRNQRFKDVEKSLNLSSFSARLGKKTIEWEHIGMHYGNHVLFEDFSYSLLRQDRIGIIGRNGCGKSTLLNILAGDIQPSSGTISFGDTVLIGYFRQGDEMVDLSMRAIDYIKEVAEVIHYGKETLTASQMMERFLFPKQMHYTPLERLSGGERRRLYLCRILMQGPNILLLDEPTNDLDLLTLEVLEDYLDTFMGAIITVSHDRYFLDRVCDKVFVMENQHWQAYTGGYSDYLEKKKDCSKSSQEKKVREKSRSSLSYLEKKELENLPEQMETIQNQIDTYDQKMQGVMDDFTKLSEYSQKRSELEEQLETLTLRWMELEEKMEE